MRYIIIIGHLQVKFCVTWLDFTESCAATRLPIREFLSPDYSGKSGLIRDRKTEKL